MSYAALDLLLKRCKCGVYLTVNEHRDDYETPAQRLEWYGDLECPPRISDEVRSGILASGNIVDLHFYPDTPIGSYHIVHHDLAAALAMALDCLGIGPPLPEIAAVTSGLGRGGGI